MILNAIYMDYLGAKKGFHSDRALDTIGKSLEKYLADDEFYEHTQNPGAYDDGFRKMCKRIKEKKPSLDKLVSRWIKRRCRICARLKAQWLNIKTRWAEQLYVFFSG